MTKKLTKDTERPQTVVLEGRWVDISRPHNHAIEYWVGNQCMGRIRGGMWWSRYFLNEHVKGCYMMTCDAKEAFQQLVDEFFSDISGGRITVRHDPPKEVD